MFSSFLASHYSNICMSIWSMRYDQWVFRSFIIILAKHFPCDMSKWLWHSNINVKLQTNHVADSRNLSIKFVNEIRFSITLCSSNSPNPTGYRQKSPTFSEIKKKINDFIDLRFINLSSASFFRYAHAVFCLPTFAEQISLVFTSHTE